LSIGQRRPATQVLAEIIGDTERRTWDLSTALQHYAAADGDDNPILHAAWDQYPFLSDEPGMAGL
jgi:hypothetical protein